MKLVATSIKIPQELLDKLQELADADIKVNSRNDYIKNVLFKHVEEVYDDKTKR